MIREPGVFDNLLDAAIDSTRADFGNVQVVDSTGDYLVIAAQRGFPPAFLQTFARVDRHDGTACGRAWRSRQRVVIPDVEADATYAPYRRAAKEAGYRAVQSTPLINRRGVVLGVLSTHVHCTQRLGAEATMLLELYARIGAAYLEYEALEPRVMKGTSDTADGSFGTAIELADAIAKLKEYARSEPLARCEALARAVCRLAETRVSGLIALSQKSVDS